MFFSFPYLQRELEASCSDTDIRHSYHTIDIRCEVRGNIQRSCSRICIVKVNKIFTLFKSLKRHYVPLLFFRTEILYWLGLATDALSWAPITLMWVDLQAKRTRCKPEFHTFFPSKIKSMLTKQNKRHHHLNLKYLCCVQYHQIASTYKTTVSALILHLLHFKASASQAPPPGTAMLCPNKAAVLFMPNTYIKHVPRSHLNCQTEQQSSHNCRSSLSYPFHSFSFSLINRSSY